MKLKLHTYSVQLKKSKSIKMIRMKKNEHEEASKCYDDDKFKQHYRVAICTLYAADDFQIIMRTYTHIFFSSYIYINCNL